MKKITILLLFLLSLTNIMAQKREKIIRISESSIVLTNDILTQPSLTYTEYGYHIESKFNEQSYYIFNKYGKIVESGVFYNGCVIINPKIEYGLILIGKRKGMFYDIEKTYTFNKNI